MFVKVSIVLGLCCVLYANGGPVVDIKKCKVGDGACILSSAVQLGPRFIEGIPEINLKSLKPLHLESVNASTDSLLFNVKDFDVMGFDTCKFRRITVENSQIFVDLSCNFHAEGPYEINGKVLVIPFQGSGKLTVNLKNIEANIIADVEEKKGKDGKPHWSVKKWNYTYDLKSKSDLHFENLFPGNDVLGKAARDVLSENANEVIKDIGGPIINAIIGKVVENVQRLFKKIPLEDLIIA